MRCSQTHTAVEKEEIKTMAHVTVIMNVKVSSISRFKEESGEEVAEGPTRASRVQGCFTCS